MHDQYPFRARIVTSTLRIFFSLLYHSFAWAYDWVANFVSVGLWNEWVRSVLPYLTGKQVLEIGIGTGHLLSYLHQKSPSPIGLEPSQQMIRIASRRIGKLGLSPIIVRGLAQNQPFKCNSFDNVVSTFPSEYIFDPNTLLEILRVLKPGGSLHILLYARITGKRPLHRAAAWLFRITGESPPTDVVQLLPLQSVGFTANAEIIHMKSSNTIIIHAQKPPN